MGRTKLVMWEYECDLVNDEHIFTPGGAILPVSQGERCNTRRGTVVQTQADADEVARQAGWTIGKRIVCPSCAGADT